MLNRKNKATSIQSLPAEVVGYWGIHFLNGNDVANVIGSATFFSKAMNDERFWLAKIANDFGIDRSLLNEFDSCYPFKQSRAISYQKIYLRMQIAMKKIKEYEDLPIKNYYFSSYYHFILLVACTDDIEFFNEALIDYEKDDGFLFSLLAGSKTISYSMLIEIKLSFANDATSIDWYLDTILFAGCVDLLKNFLNYEINNRFIPKGLIYAVQTNNLALVNYLLDFESFRFDHNLLKEAVLIAIKKGNKKIIDFFLSKKIPICPEMLIAAVKSEDVTLVKYFLNKITSRLAREAALDCAAAEGKLEVVKIILARDVGASLETLNLAANSGNKALVQYLIKEHNLTINLTTFKNAVLSGRIELIEFLFSELQLASVQITSDWLYECKNCELIRGVISDPQEIRLEVDENIINCAARFGDLDLFKNLIARFNPIKPDHRALNLAIKSGNLQLVQYLIIEFKITPNVANLRFAASHGYLEILEWLLDPAHQYEVFFSEENQLTDLDHDLLVTYFYCLEVFYVLENPEKLAASQQSIEEMLHKAYINSFKLFFKFMKFALEVPEKWQLSPSSLEELKAVLLPILNEHECNNHFQREKRLSSSIRKLIGFDNEVQHSFKL